MKSLSVPVHSGDFTIPVYELPMKKSMHGSIAKYSIGEPTPDQSTYDKKLMIASTKSANKTAVINTMVNFIFDVKWEDKFQFKLSRDESTHDQIIVYTIYPQKGSPLDFTLTIIDTPEFQDVSNIEYNNRITQQMQELFEGSNDIDYLNGIALVTSADLPQSDPAKKHIFHSILSSFGKDLAGNIFMMVTSPNNQHPQERITAIKIPFAGYYKFENLALYACTDNARSKETYYKNFVSFQKFLVVFSDMQSVNLNMTISVLNKYKELQLKEHANILTKLVDKADSKVEELEEEENKLDGYEDDITNNEKFTYEVTVTEKTRVYDPSNKVVTFCTKCEYLCHDSCGYDDTNKYCCSSMDGGKENSARCLKCPRRCFWKEHVSRSYYYKEYEVKKTIVNEEMKRKYHEAQKDKEVAEEAISDIEKYLKNIESDVICTVNNIQGQLLYLDDTHLLPNSLIVREQLLELIKTETNEQCKLFYKQQQAILKAKDGVDNLRGDAQNESDRDVKIIWYRHLTVKEKP